ncbi:hypothetical protein EIN_300030 [Entamoeba invadens IP1]|uniref:Uncharacterized protein n=1 Tax=Entamoeba invadens IP1 TaxID=370355 RepID=A0A0A1UCD7_ENTIV|nr:hypothetical protein EIN_300030 [Entamoeba invadens IP1]ELP89944.1 hypothetical protein EIN_300030 [Entamoeba invadens IP1]|eukprot:XP_004256715.1 hypothetical protein EIN_300030 [Entamoeba invadens IP1]
MLGGIFSGKSSICERLIYNTFCICYDPTKEGVYETLLFFDRKLFDIEIYDGTSSDCCTLQMIYYNYIRKCDGYVIVYSITSYTSFLEANKFRERIYQILDIDEQQHLPILMVGNKIDLENEREVEYNKTIELTQQWKVGFIECSTKTNKNVNKILQLVCEDALTIADEIKNKNKYTKNHIVRHYAAPHTHSCRFWRCYSHRQSTVLQVPLGASSCQHHLDPMNMNDPVGRLYDPILLLLLGMASDCCHSLIMPTNLLCNLCPGFMNLVLSLCATMLTGMPVHLSPRPLLAVCESLTMIISMSLMSNYSIL